MKIKIHIKDPDTLHDAIYDAVENLTIEGLSEGEVMDLAEKWFEYSEYVTLEIDTEAKTCIVLERKDLI